ncbi:hypothetical protein ACEPAF_4969 [Sanghuangporus sanghuang]
MEPPHVIYNQAGPSNFAVPYSQEGRPPPPYGAGRGRGHPGYRHANANYHQTHQTPFFSPGVAGSYAGYTLGLNGTTGPPLHGQYSHAQNSLPPGRRPGPSYHAGNFPAPPSPALHPTHMYNPHSSPYMSPTAVPSPGPMYPYPHAPGHLHPYPAPFSPPTHQPPPSFSNHQNVKSPSTVLADSAASSPKTWNIQHPSSPRPLQVSSTPLPMQQKEAPSPAIPLNPSPPSPAVADDLPQRAELPASSPSTKSSSPAAEIRSLPLPNSPPSPTISLPSFDSEPAPQQEWVISAFRPDNPAAAFGLMISPKARPPSHIFKGAQQYINPIHPKATPSEPASVEMPELKEHEATDTGNESPADGVASQTEQVSCSTTETESRTSTVPDAFVAGSPLSTATSVSTAPPKTDSLAQNEAQTVPAPTEPSISAESPKSTVSARLPPTTNEESSGSAPAVKKSWASLLRSDASSSKTKLPTSSVQGISIPARSAAGPSSLPVSSGPGGKKAELLRLLSNGPAGGSSAPQIRPRGLVNTGNMCFANAVLQTLIYTPPFYRFFTELGNFKGTGVTSTEWAGKDAPLVDATVEFLKEFKPKVRDSLKDSSEDDEDYAAIDSFIPSYVYDAMKGKSRFDNMGGGQQEDAEEFFGFFLDSIEEEFLAMSKSLKDGSQSRPARHDRDATDGDDWMEVGRKNKPIVARTVKSADSPMTRIFGGKFRSTLRVPGQRDSVVVEDWRSLKLDIQREQVESIEDALRYISHPQPVQMSSVTKGGAIVEASQQVLVDALPPILVLHLKRFLYDTSAKDVIKVHKQVTYGPELEVPSGAMSPVRRTAHPAKYKLFAVLYHHGTSAAGGHYTLDVLHPNRNADASAKPREGWIRIDDELVTDLRTEEVFGKERDCAYLLFYRRIAGSYARAGQIARSRVRARVVLPRRCLATATASPGSVSRPSSEPVVPLSNVEAQWGKLSADEQLVVQQQIDELQKRDWKNLSMDEKRAAYYVAFGPHGPRTPVTPAGQPLKIFLAVVFGVSVAGTLSYAIRATAPPPPKTLTKEWQEAMNERAKEQQMNPISGVSSEGYKGKGFVQ